MATHDDMKIFRDVTMVDLRDLANQLSTIDYDSKYLPDSDPDHSTCLSGKCAFSRQVSVDPSSWPFLVTKDSFTSDRAREIKGVRVSYVEDGEMKLSSI
jgi:hypothetical protein